MKAMIDRKKEMKTRKPTVSLLAACHPATEVTTWHDYGGVKTERE